MYNYTLSVVIPAYNCENTISQTLDSLVNQKSNDLEIIIINDGSIDGTESICKEYSDKHDNIKYFHKENSGVSDTRNVGIRNANGKYIAFLDSDDVWDKDYYDEELNKQLQTEEYDILVFSSCFSDMDLNVHEYVKVKEQLLFENKDTAVDMYYHSFCSFIYKTSLISDHNLYFNNTLRYGEDELFRSQCLYLAKKVLAQDKLSFYYRDNINSSTKINRKQKLYSEQKLRTYYLLKDFFFEQYRLEGTEITVKNATTAKYFIDAIRLLAETGYGYKSINQICENENIKQISENSQKIFRLHYSFQNTLNDYLKSPFLFYIKNRFHGMWYNTALEIKHKLIRIKNRSR